MAENAQRSWTPRRFVIDGTNEALYYAHPVNGARLKPGESVPVVEAVLLEVAQARATVLEAAVQQAQNTVEFLHGCLTDETFEYAYPEQTVQRLREWAELAPRDPACVHSRTVEGCEGCEAHIARRRRLADAREALRGSDKEGDEG